ncbi:glycosyltransferase [Lacticaseibacillus sp. 53-4]|uniref:glycosyltransferase n=1 Tax=Lacticaseibacillus sp. 53-4 TaxID=2799575 RepID=UPI0019408C8E|nr:glycosyltransferase [Lacticaseibacillus sp. 53-4]
MEDLKTVTVLLSTYNGEHYLKQLLDSLLVQKGVRVDIIVRDDGSTDHTRQILSDYKGQSGIQVYLGENIGWRDSFMTLLASVAKEASSDYYAFADQDDIYASDKFLAAVTKLAPHESQPALYHSNVTLADGDGHAIGDRYPRNFQPTGHLPEAFFDVTWLGTTMVFNRRLMALLAEHVPIDNIVHDAYVMNVAQFLGTVVYDPTPHMLYRRHDSAVTGFGGKSDSQKIKAPSLLDRYRRYKHNPVIHPFSKRAHELLVGYSDQLLPDQRRFLTAVATYRTNFRARLDLLFNPGIRASKLRPTLQIRYRVLANTL